VAEGQRSAGAGARLLAAAKNGAKARLQGHVGAIKRDSRARTQVSTNGTAYEHYKTQKSFRKPL